MVDGSPQARKRSNRTAVLLTPIYPVSVATQYTLTLFDYVELLCVNWQSRQHLASPMELQLIDVANKRLLNPMHNEMPIYTPFLKTSVSIGHFIITSNGGRDPLVGQVLGRSNNVNYPEHFINVCCFHPLFTRKQVSISTTLPYSQEGYVQQHV
jgi:hypothetical protein